VLTINASTDTTQNYFSYTLTYIYDTIVSIFRAIFCGDCCYPTETPEIRQAEVITDNKIPNPKNLHSGPGPSTRMFNFVGNGGRIEHLDNQLNNPVVDVNVTKSVKGRERIECFLREHDLDTSDSALEGWSPLHEAIVLNPKVIKTLIDHGADLQAKTGGGLTPHDLATHVGKEEVIALIEGKEVINANEEFIKALCDGSDSSTIESLLNHSEFDPNFKINMQHHQVICDFVKSFQREGHNEEDGTIYKNWQPLHVAIALNAKESTVKILIDLGADVNNPIQNIFTPLSLAIMTQNKDLVSLLLENDIPNAITTLNGIEFTHTKIANNPDTTWHNPDIARVVSEHYLCQKEEK